MSPDEIAAPAGVDAALTGGTPESQAPVPSRDSPRQDVPGQNAEPAAREGEESSQSESDTEQRPRRKSSNQIRIEQLRSQVADLERQNTHYRTLAERGGQPRRLDPLQFQSDADYQRALIQETARQSQSEFARTQAQTAASQAQMIEQQIWDARVGDFREQMPDFEQVAYSGSVTYSQHGLAMVRQMSEGPQVAYYLGKNPAEAQRIAQLTPLETAFELGRLATRINAGNARRVSSAPPPVTTLRGSARATPNLESMSMDEYIAYRSKH